VLNENKAIATRWLQQFWGKDWNPAIVCELAAPGILMHHSLHEPMRGQVAVRSFMIDYRESFPDLEFRGVGDLLAEGEYVVGRWEGGGTHTGPAFSDFRMGSIAAASGRKMRFAGTTVLRMRSGRIVEDLGQEDALTAMQQLGLLRAPEREASAQSGRIPLPPGWNRMKA